MPDEAEKARNNLEKVFVFIKKRCVNPAENQPNDEVRQNNLEEIQHERQHAVSPAVSAHHIGCARVAAAGFADIALVHQLAHNN